MVFVCIISPVVVLSLFIVLVVSCDIVSRVLVFMASVFVAVQEMVLSLDLVLLLPLS